MRGVRDRGGEGLGGVADAGNVNACLCLSDGDYAAEDVSDVDVAEPLLVVRGGPVRGPERDSMRSRIQAGELIGVTSGDVVDGLDAATRLPRTSSCRAAMS